MQLVEGIEGAALAGAIDALLVTQQSAERAGIAGPIQGWGPWAAALTAAGQGQLEPAPVDQSIGDVPDSVTVTAFGGILSLSSPSCRSTTGYSI